MTLPQHLSQSNEHFTPAYIVDAARETMGAIDLDPASCAEAQRTVKAARWYGRGSPFGEDGLREPWAGRVFLNPPGGTVRHPLTKSSAAMWWGLLVEAWSEGLVTQAIFVGFTLEILRSAQGLGVRSPLRFPFCVPSSRIAFTGGSPTHANVIVYIPPDEEHSVRFVEVFSPIGECRL